MDSTSIKLNGLRAAVAAALLLVALVLVGRSAAQTGPVVSVDAVPDGSNTATSVGAIDTCRAVATGAIFTADVVIQGVTGIAGVEGHLIYNSSVLRVTAVSYAFLIGSAGGSLVELGDTVPDSDGDFELGVVTFPLMPATGSGVLARMTFEALRSGTSPLDLQNVKLSDALSAPIPPADVTGVFTGTVNDASAVADGACSDPDGDNDGFSDVIEAFVGTLPLDACGVNAWPVDNNDDHKAGLSDILAYIPVFNSTAPGPPYSARYDLNADNKIGLSDILMFIPFFNITCTP